MSKLSHPLGWLALCLLAAAPALAQNVGINTTTPTSSFQVAGTVAVSVASVPGGSGSGTRISDYPAGYLGLNPGGSNSDNYFVLPTASSCPGRVYYMRNNSNDYIAYIGSEGGTIYGATTGNNPSGPYQMQPNMLSKTVVAVSDGTNWTIGALN